MENIIPIKETPRELKTASKKSFLSKDNVLEWIQDNYSIPIDYDGPIKIKLDIRSLWPEHFRLNYWGYEKDAKDETVIYSMFVRVKKINNKYRLEHINKDEIRR